MKPSLLLILSLFAWATLAADPFAPPVVVELFKPSEVAQPASVVGNGSPDSVTEEALQKALNKGGVIVFNTGGQPAVLKLTKTLVLPQLVKPTVIDGFNLVTLDGGGKIRILQKEWKTELTVQRLKFQHGRTEKEGAALWNVNWDGRMTVIDCQFDDCKTTAAGPDIGGGAIRMTGQKNLIVSGCKFTDCAGSNGGAICTIGCQMTIVGNTFINCRAFGTGGGADAGPNGQGGIGGAIYVDGVDQNADKKQLYVGDCYFKNNSAGAHAGAVFGYTRPKQDSLSIYYNNIFENSSVDEIKNGYRSTHGGALYVMYCHLHVINCTFANNKSPTIAGAVFTAQMASEKYVNCEFYRNTPEHKAGGENITLKQRDIPPAVAALGRMPGYQEKSLPSQKAKETKPLAAATAAPAAPPPPPAPKIDDKVLADFDARLRTRLAAVLKDGKSVSTYLRLMGPKDSEQKYDVAAVDSDNLTVKVQNNPMPVKWSKLSPRDKAMLGKALASAAESDAEALVLAGVYFAVIDQPSDAEDYFSRAAVLDAAAVQAAKATLSASAK